MSAREELRPVEVNILNKEIYKGWYLGQEQIVWNTRFNGGIEDMEAYSQAIIEKDDGTIVKVGYESIRFLDRLGGIKNE